MARLRQTIAHFKNALLRYFVLVIILLHIVFHWIASFFPETDVLGDGDEFKFILGSSEVSLLTIWTLMYGNRLAMRLPIAVCAATTVVVVLSFGYISFPRPCPWTPFDWLGYFGIDPGARTLSTALYQVPLLLLTYRMAYRFGVRMTLSNVSSTALRVTGDSLRRLFSYSITDLIVIVGCIAVICGIVRPVQPYVGWSFELLQQLIAVQIEGLWPFGLADAIIMVILTYLWIWSVLRGRLVMLRLLGTFFLAYGVQFFAELAVQSLLLPDIASDQFSGTSVHALFCTVWSSLLFALTMLLVRVSRVGTKAGTKTGSE